MKSERNQNVEQVAAIIAEYPWAYDFDSAEQFARQQNEGAGWSFECRYPGEVPGNNYARVEGLRLSESDLTLALRLAAEWDSGNRYATAAQLRQAAHA